MEFLRTSPLLNSIRTLLSKNQWDFEILLTSALNLRIPMDKFKLFLKTMLSISTSLASIVSSLETQMPKCLKTITDQIVIDFTIIPDELLKPIQNDIISNEMTEKFQNEIEVALQDLENHKKEITKVLGLSSFEYTTVSGTYVNKWMGFFKKKKKNQQKLGIIE